jgi:hypothetical protein
MRKFIVYAALVGGLLMSGAVAAWPASVTASGAVKVVTGAASSTPRVSGGSATPFSLKLPPNSTCQGDSAHANFRVQSFVVPAGTDPGTIAYKSQGPKVAGGWALYMPNTRAFIQEQTDNASNDTAPGPILPLPDLNFAVFTGGELPAGHYVVGVACTLYNQTTRYWATDIVVTADAKDTPSHLRWRLAKAASAGGGSSGPGRRLALVVVVGVIAVAGVVTLIRRAGSAS